MLAPIQLHEGLKQGNLASFSSFCTALSLNDSLRGKGKLHLLIVK